MNKSVSVLLGLGVRCFMGRKMGSFLLRVLSTVCLNFSTRFIHQVVMSKASELKSIDMKDIIPLVTGGAPSRFLEYLFPCFGQ